MTGQGQCFLSDTSSPAARVSVFVLFCFLCSAVVFVCTYSFVDSFFRWGGSKWVVGSSYCSPSDVSLLAEP